LEAKFYHRATATRPAICENSENQTERGQFLPGFGGISVQNGMKA
jgi:hypothetical protein